MGDILKMKTFVKRTWAEVNVDAISANIAEIRKIVGDKVKIMASVKADGYGHGVKMTAKTVLEAGTDCLAVSCVNEALEIRNFGIDAPILVLGYTPEGEYEDAINNDITLTVFRCEDAAALDAVAMRLGKTAKVHIKINVGMNRIGFETSSVDDAAEILNMKNLFAEGIFTHFPCADENEDELTKKQFKKYTDFVNKLEEKCGKKIPVHHVCNSAATAKFKPMHLDMVRVGIIVYGLYPSEDFDKNLIKLKPAMSIKTIVSRIQCICKGEKISYGGTYAAEKEMKIATLPIGYADGLSRHLSNKGKVIIGGKYANIVGKVCMDQCMIDVTDVNNVNVGDEVIIMGCAGGKCVSADALAGIIGTINYEIVCDVGKRVPRVYLKNGEITDILNQLV